MRVMCINNEGWTEKKSYLLGLFKRDTDCNGPKYGDYLTVIDSCYMEGELYYQLLEWPTKIEDGWLAKCFVPLSDIDETTFERNLIGQMDHNYRW